jgi:hypothetical protein
MTELQRYFANNTDLEILPDNAQWKNRFEIKSESSNRIYVVAQRISDNSWGCSCPGFKNARNGHLNRTCKHLKVIKPLIEEAEKFVKKQLN